MQITERSYPEINDDQLYYLRWCGGRDGWAWAETRRNLPPQLAPVYADAASYKTMQVKGMTLRHILTYTPNLSTLTKKAAQPWPSTTSPSLTVTQSPFGLSVSITRG